MSCTKLKVYDIILFETNFEKNMQTDTLIPSQKQLWFAAIKPPMYTVAVIPIITGTALAFSQTHHINWTIFSLFLTSAILIIAWLNLTNDVFDADTGIDVNKAHSIVNLTGNKSLIFWIAKLLLLIAFGELFAISYLQKDWMVLELIGLACFLGYTYQGPPFRLGYQGLGEIICFFTFGILAISAVYYSQTQSFSLVIIPTSILIGITTSIILFCSHFHQVQDDISAGKKSPIVRLGTEKGVSVLKWSTLSVFILLLGFVIFDYLSWKTLIIYISLPLASQLISFVQTYHDQPEQVKNCKFLAVNWHFASGMLLALGLVL